VDVAEAARLNPAVRLDGVIGAAFCQADGFVRPLEILHGYLEAAQRLGATLITGAEPIALEVRGDRVEAVRTAQETIACGCVINAAGPWAAEVARLAGVLLPVAPLRRQVACTAPTSALPADMPMTLWCDDGFHLRVRDGRALLLRPSPGDPRDPFDMSVEESWLDAMAATVRERVPALAEVPIDRERCWAGLYEMSPDKHALLGAAPGCENLFLANGSSGHGVMHAPALGALLAEIVIHGRARSLDAHALRPSRFAEGEPIAGAGVL
jgi:sarcosine oxidase, subunit beta